MGLWIDRSLLIAWFGGTLVRQFCVRKPRRLARADLIGIIPSWRFFGPNPQTFEYTLSVAALEDVKASKLVWTDITPFKCERLLVRSIWNPNRRLRKRLLAHIREIVRISQGQEPSAVKKTFAYKAVLDYAFNYAPMPSKHTLRCFRIWKRDLLERGTEVAVYTSSIYEPIDAADSQ